MGLVCLMMNGPFTSHRFMFAAAPKPCLARHPVLPVRVCPRLGSLTELT